MSEGVCKPTAHFAVQRRLYDRVNGFLASQWRSSGRLASQITGFKFRCTEKDAVQCKVCSNQCKSAQSQFNMSIISLRKIRNCSLMDQSSLLVCKICFLTKRFQVKQFYIFSDDSAEIIHCMIPSVSIALLCNINNILVHKSDISKETEFDP